MARRTSSRTAWAASTFTYTQRKSPAPPAVQQVAQGEQGGRLAGLAGRMQHEVAFVPDQFQDRRQVQSFQRRDAVVIPRDDGPFRIELPHDPSMTSGRDGY